MTREVPQNEREFITRAHRTLLEMHDVLRKRETLTGENFPEELVNAIREQLDIFACESSSRSERILFIRLYRAFTILRESNDVYEFTYGAKKAFTLLEIALLAMDA